MRRGAAAFLLAGWALLLAAPGASAVSFTNGTEGPPNKSLDGPLSIQYHCGLFCSNEWKDVEPGQTVSHPGKGGRFWSDIFTDFIYGPWPSACERPDALGGDDDHPVADPGDSWTLQWSGGQNYFWQDTTNLQVQPKYSINWGIVNEVNVGYMCDEYSPSGASAPSTSGTASTPTGATGPAQ